MDRAYLKKQDADIWASDMRDIEATSKISETFDDATVFLTGATGFLGKIFLEKLLRSCPKLKMIYILVRPKKGIAAEKRIEELFEGPNMVPLKLVNPKFREKVTIINGDLVLPDLGMDEVSKRKIIEEVNFIIHCAATVRFDQHIRTASYINVRSLRDLVSMAKEMKELKGFLHVSTAFSNCPRKEIGEEFYEPGMDPYKLLDLVDAIDEERLTNMTPGLIGDWPNTYAFTKCVAEDIVRREIHNIPIAMIRPSIVIGSVDEPLKGWIDNMYGPTGVLVGAATGVIRVMHGRITNNAELIPADYVINTGIAVLWDLAMNRTETKSIEQPLPVYNVVSTPESPLTWRNFMHWTALHAKQIPSELIVWHNGFWMVENQTLFSIFHFLLHIIPSYIVDFICLCLGKERMMVNGYRRITKFLYVLTYFVIRQWEFKNENTKNLWKKMHAEDRKRYAFSMKDFDWNNFFHFYVRGARVYLLKDPLDTIPKGRVKYWKLFIAHYTLVAALSFLFLKFLCYACRCII